eukprot:gene6432-8850_t
MSKESDSKYEKVNEESDTKLSYQRAEGKLDKHTSNEDEFITNSYDAKDSIDSKAFSDEELIQKVSEYFFGNDELAAMFENFVKVKSAIVDLESTEYKLGYTEVYEEYKSLFEMKMESFIINSLKSSIQAFYLALKRKMDDDYDSSESFFGQILMGVTEFDVFMTMMREAAQTRARDEANNHK